MRSIPSTGRPRGWPPCSIGSTGPVIDPDFDRFQKALGIETTVARGPHVILLHQHSDAEADERIALLERVITGYHLTVRRARASSWPSRAVGWSRPGLPIRKTTWLSCDPRTPTAFATTRGYFHPTWDAVVAFDARSIDRQQTARNKLAAKRDELQRYGELVDQAPARSRIKIKLADEPARTVGRAEAKVLLARIDGEITCETMLLDLDRRSIDLGTAAHEMIHQLASDSGLVPRHDAFPVWLHEGFGGAIRGDPRRPMGGHQPCARPATTRLAAAAEPARRWSAWSATPVLVAATSATCTPRPGPWSISFAPSTLSSFSRSSTCCAVRVVTAESPVSPAGDRVFDAFQRAFGTDLDRLEGNGAGS